MTPLKRAFEEAKIPQKVIAIDLNLSPTMVAGILSGKHLNKHYAKLFWKLLPVQQRTYKLAGEIAETLLNKHDLMDVCSIDKKRAFAYFEFF